MNTASKTPQRITKWLCTICGYEHRKKALAQACINTSVPDNLFRVGRRFIWEFTNSDGILTRYAYEIEQITYKKLMGRINTFTIPHTPTYRVRRIAECVNGVWRETPFSKLRSEWEHDKISDLKLFEGFYD